MAKVTTPEIGTVSMQQMLDCGINAFAVDLLVESYAKHPNPKPVRFLWRGVWLTLEPWKEGDSQPASQPQAETIVTDLPHDA